MHNHGNLFSQCYIFNQAGFAKALKMVEGEFLETVNYFKDAWLPARTIVQRAIDKRYEVKAIEIKNNKR